MVALNLPSKLEEIGSVAKSLESPKKMSNLIADKAENKEEIRLKRPLSAESRLNNLMTNNKNKDKKS